MGFKILFSNQNETILGTYSFSIGKYQISLQGNIKQEFCFDLTTRDKNDCVLFDGEVKISYKDESESTEREVLFRLKTYREKYTFEEKLNLEVFVKRLLEEKEGTLEEEISSLISKSSENKKISPLETCIGTFYPAKETRLEYTF